MAKDCSTPVLSNVAVVLGDENEIELSLGLSIGRSVGSSAPNLEISGENFGTGLTGVVVTTPDMAKVGDSEQEIVVSQQGDTEGDNQLERKRKRPETLPMNGYYKIGEGSNKRETIGRKSLTDEDGEMSSSDAQVFSMQVPQQNVSGILRLGNQESVTGGVNGSGGILEVNNISPAGSSSVPTSGFKSNYSLVEGEMRGGFRSSVAGSSVSMFLAHQFDNMDTEKSQSRYRRSQAKQDIVGSSESRIGPMGIHDPITPSEVIGSSSSCHPPPPSPTNSIQSEDPDTNLRMFRPPRIPYVTTAGNGPNCREVNGFLYKYSDEEVSIICACHGRSFSPVQFVMHSGGVYTPHPLRHIIVMDTAFIPFPS